MRIFVLCRVLCFVVVFCAIFSLSYTVESFADDAEMQAQAYADTKGLSPELEQAHAKAVKGDAKAQQTLGHAYFFGKKAPKDESRGLFWLKKAAAQGDAKAMMWLGHIKISKPAHKDVERGLQLLKEAAAKDAIHAYALGYYLLFGETYGVKQDMKGAIQAALQGVKINDPEALGLLAYLSYLANAQSTEPDYLKALQYAGLAADYGSGLGYAVLAMIYADGHVVEVDDKKAFERALKAADDDVARGMALLGHFYYLGKGVEKDLQKAVELAKKAAARGDDFGRVLLAHMYSEGDGVTQDIMLAYAYLLLAVDNGDAAARSDIAKLEEKITDEQRKKAKAQVAAWRKEWGFIPEEK